MKQELVKLANHLDNIGHRDLADRLDDVIKLAQERPATVRQRGAPEGDFSPQETSGPDKEWYEEKTEEAKLTEEELAPPMEPVSNEAHDEADDASLALDEADDASLALDEADDTSLALDEALASDNLYDRINKMAELMSGEFTLNDPGIFRR
jgi:hypothetical protein